VTFAVTLAVTFFGDRTGCPDKHVRTARRWSDSNPADCDRCITPARPLLAAWIGCDVWAAL
jgi:hypothetical protein